MIVGFPVPSRTSETDSALPTSPFLANFRFADHSITTSFLAAMRPPQVSWEGQFCSRESGHLILSTSKETIRKQIRHRATELQIAHHWRKNGGSQTGR